MSETKKTRIIKKITLIVLTTGLCWTGIFMLNIMGHNCTHFRAESSALPPMMYYALLVIDYSPWFILLLPLISIVLITRAKDYTFTALAISLLYLIGILFAAAGFMSPYILM